jgi:class 3 adenylate cyclase/tetratricopeptide (TPR) repeat protein
MSDIRQWLDALGLGEYAEAFEAEKIAPGDLSEFSEEDLNALGLPLGPRRRVLKAARAQAEAGLEPELPEPTAPRDAERRQITVMFCDLVGSTALSEQLDPEDLRALMAAYRKAVGAVIKRFDGHIAQYLGDGVMAYVGWPRAHEDDAERSVRSALAIVDAVKRVDAPATLQVRLGITTGPVVVGEGADDDAEANKLAVGETPNIAARLQALAGPDQIVIGPGTHRLIGGTFEYRDLGERDLKGILKPVQSWQVTGASQAEGRFEAQAAGGLTPFVGRETEIQLLLDRWQHAKDGEGQVVLLSGEPGIGKSRVTQVLRERLEGEPHVRLRYQCSPFYTNSAFYPIIGQLERAAGFARDDTAETKLDKLETLLAQGTEDVAKVAPLLASLLSLPVDRYPPLNLSPQRQKDDTVAALAAQVTGLAEHQPLLMLVEDAHWCDPTTLETLTAVIGAIEAARVLLVITYRPEFDPPWTGYGHVVAQSLSRLGKRQGADMVAKVTGGKALPNEVLDQIVAKTDGIPLFVEELTKTVLEAGFLKDSGDRYELDGPLPPLAIPSTLQDSLMARLDRLSPVKEVAQIAACIGREFSHELIAAVSPLRDNELEDALQQLVNSELIFRRGTPPDATYTFKHALVQESAYNSLLKSRRQVVHQDIAAGLERIFPDKIATEPELLAHHYTEAGQPSLSAPLWLRAGQMSLGKFSLSEAIIQLQRGLSEIGHIEASESRDKLELDLRMTLGSAYIAMVGWTVPEVRNTLEPAYKLATGRADNFAVLSTGWNLWVHHAPRCEFDIARRYVQEMIAYGTSKNDSAVLVGAYSAAAMNEFWRGNFTQALDHFGDLRAIYDRDSHGELVLTLNHDPLDVTLGWGAACEWIRGHPDQAREMAREQIESARQTGHPFNYCFSVFLGAMLWTLTRDDALAEDAVDEAIRIGRDQAMPLFENLLVPLWHGPLLINSGQNEQGYRVAKQGVDGWLGLGGKITVPMVQNMMAVATLRMGDPDGALAQVNDTIGKSIAHGHLTYLADSHRTKGDILFQGFSDLENAETEYARALDLARKQGAKSWELRAATSLARLWQSQNKTKQAHDLLFPVYDWFTEGFDTADLKDAKVLLGELG